MDEKNIKAYDKGGTGIQTLESLEEAVRYNSWIVSLLKPFFGERNLELGAGSGTITAIALKQTKVETVEFAPANHNYLIKRFIDHQGYKDAGRDYFKVKQSQQYDCIFSANVLEHFQDDLTVIDHASKLLKPGGYFVAIVPAGGKLLFSQFDEELGHHRRYSNKDKIRIKKFLDSNSNLLKLESYRYYNPIGFFGWLVMMKWLGRNRINLSSIKSMEYIIPIQSFLTDWMHLPFGQNIRIVIRKNESI